MDKKRFKKCQDVYLYIQNQYYHYDSQEGRYCGDKYTKQVFEGACDYFSLPLEKIEEMYSEYGTMSSKIRDFRTALNIIRENPKLLNATKLNNKKVKLNVDKILQDKARANPKFVNFVKNNKNTTFTAITDKKVSTMYTFKEDNTWLFLEDDLMEVECGDCNGNT